MPYIVTIHAHYDGDADVIFDQALNFAEMVDAMSDIAVYDGIPDGCAVQGMTVTADVTFWGVIKNKGHVMHIETLDQPNRILQSREHGKRMKQWDHLLTVEPTAGGAVWTDQITLNSGWSSWAMARFCRFMYCHRHRRREARSLSATIQPLRIT